MERIEQKEDNPILLNEMGDVVFIGEFVDGQINNLIPIEKQSIPALIAALQKYIE